MVKDGRLGEVTVEGESAGDVPVADPIDQLLAQGGVILERDLQVLTKVFLLEAAKIQGVVLAGGADIVDNQVVMSDFVTFLSMIPEPADVRDQLAAMVNQGVVDGNDTLGTVGGVGVVDAVG